MKVIYRVELPTNEVFHIICPHDASFIKSGFDSDTWELGPDRPKAKLEEITVFESYSEYKSVVNKKVLELALAKLTAEEKKLLGLNFPPPKDDE